MKQIIIDTNKDRKFQHVVPTGEQHQAVEIITKDSVLERDVNILVEKNSEVEYIFLLDETIAGSYREKRTVELQENAKAHIYYCYFGDQEQTIRIHNKIGQRASLEHRVLFFGNNEQVFDVKEIHQFTQPDGYGKFLAHGFLKDKAKSNYDSIIIIDPHAQKVDSRLDLHSFILGDKARSVMVPSLQIEANDVKAGHGATVSHINDEDLFYLQSRGLTYQQARHLFLDGLFNDFVGQFDCDMVKERILEILKNKYSI